MMCLLIQQIIQQYIHASQQCVEWFQEISINPMHDSTEYPPIHAYEVWVDSTEYPSILADKVRVDSMDYPPIHANDVWVFCTEYPPILAGVAC